MRSTLTGLAARATGFAPVISIAALLAAAACGGDDSSATTSPEGGANHDGAVTSNDGSTGPIYGPDGAIIDTGVVTPGPDGSAPDANGCQALAVAASQKVDGYNSDVFSYYDATCTLRTAALVHNDAADPGGSKGGFLRQLTYTTGSKLRTIKGTGINGWNGFGYVVDHYASSDANSQGTGGTTKTVFAGRHHAIEEFKLRVSPGGNVDVTMHWMFATGRSHPLLAITLDATPAGSNKVSADTRTPYGDMAWDENANAAVEGVGWGDSYKFKTTNSPVTQNSTWDYTEANVVPYAMEWSTTADAEMGLVQTETWARHLAGGDYGGGALASDCWKKTSANKGANCAKSGWTMPSDYLWPYQLNQYEIPFENASHRIAWGATYGAVGQASYSAFGKTLNGYPYNSYSVYVVLGTHTGAAVAAQATLVERTQAATAKGIKGALSTSGPGGVGRSDSVTYAVPGYSPVYDSWDITADAGTAATIELTPTAGALEHPTIRVLGWSSGSPPAHLQMDGKELSADVDYFASVDAAGKVLWITLNRTLPAVTQIAAL